ncbi:tRNA (adenosine(37)-N6)-threonylcarbamoyltransferase complex ATPase subunit type 1 TsaE [Patescibacteria group bacterium]|nr:tRNA (adenosine(37)-N6)-threonylcarbamoyltransferase complex ATPase subunit type 1 TsaE [Patescibacteria group bacterium]MBU1870743.1 tRNA (adenosine(37)-N6)-threonylcarbamoyltransferase complex ATPase subunit type 1 TsaE [Patescibacteria group bacterium]
MKYYTKTTKETLSLAKKFAKKLKGGEVIGLIGKLGAGKTIFTKGIALGLGINKNISSPTFVLMKIYPAKSTRAKSGKAILTESNKIKFFVHIDAYRFKNKQDLIAIGASEYFNNPQAITVIEWADKVNKILPKKTIFIKIDYYKNFERTIRVCRRIPYSV